MSEVASRELRNSTRSLLERVAEGEQLTITVDGRPVALLGPIERRPRWASRSEFVSMVLANQADGELTADLHLLAAETTDDLPLT
jgi:prevent-host-death family protein